MPTSCFISNKCQATSFGISDRHLISATRGQQSRLFCQAGKYHVGSSPVSSPKRPRRQSCGKNSADQQPPHNGRRYHFPYGDLITRTDHTCNFTGAHLCHQRNLLNSVYTYLACRQSAELLGRAFCQDFPLHSLAAAGTRFLEYLESNPRIF